MHRAVDFDLAGPLAPNEAALRQDLELDVVCEAMAAGDPFLEAVARQALLTGLTDVDDILYRQRVLADCLRHDELVRRLHALAGDALRAERAVWGGFSRDSPASALRVAVQKLTALVGFLRELRVIAAEQAAPLRSDGFTRFFAMVDDELDDAYLASIDTQLQALSFKGGMLLSAGLGAGLRGQDYVLREPRDQSWRERMFDRSTYGFTIPDRDDQGFRALSQIEDRGVTDVAAALTRSVDHVRSFFVTLRAETGFYVGCLNLHERLTAGGGSATLPEPRPATEAALSASGLYDVSLALTVGRAVAANDLYADGCSLVMITGANQGGKSTFLRSVGLAALMMQAGMFVAADTLRASVRVALFTHYKREEDASLQSGKLDEELARMSEIADHITPGCLLLCNESFASTNEREGSEIARQVIRALLHAGVMVMFVTHLFDLAGGLHRHAPDGALFLRAARGENGSRPYLITEGEPLSTSYGEDSYRAIFGVAPGQAPLTVAGLRYVSGQARWSPGGSPAPQPPTRDKG